MAIVISKLVSAAILQNFLEDKAGIPLSGGVVTFYQDANHNILKNVYEQQGVAGAYTYVAAPNPMTLSAAGTTTDQNGNDILLFYYPWDENDSTVAQPYFITVYNSQGQFQFSRMGFPFVAGGGSAPTTPNFVTQENYITNNRFWRNVGQLAGNSTFTPSSSNNGTWSTQYSTGPTQAFWTLAPDQHDGFSMPDFNYFYPTSNLGSATETITFATFPGSLTNQISNDIQPEFYINHVCTAEIAGPDAYKKTYQFPISLHLATLANEPFTFTIQTTGSITLTISIYAFAGTGSASSAATEILSIDLSAPGWTKTPINTLFPPNSDIALSSTNDDAYYLQISFESGQVDFSFAIPAIYIYDNPSATVNGTNLFSFSTYDQIDSIISSPRTGDIRTSINSFYYYGWVPMNNGGLGNASSNGTAYHGQDAWPLFNLLWTMFSAYGATAFPIYSSAGSPATYGATALADWLANKAIALTQAMGKVFLGTVPISTLLPATTTIIGNTATVTASNPSGTLLLFTVNSSNLLNLFTGNTVVFSAISAPIGNISINVIYYITIVSSTTFYVSTTFANAISGNTANYVQYSSGASNTATASLSQAGSYEGEYAHAQLSAEVGSHTHPATVFDAGSTGSFAKGNFSTGSNTANTNANSPAGVPFNVTQPGTFMNIYIKL